MEVGIGRGEVGGGTGRGVGLGGGVFMPPNEGFVSCGEESDAYGPHAFAIFARDHLFRSEKFGVA